MKLSQKNTDFFDVIFVDGLHTYEQCRTDIINSFKYLNAANTNDDYEILYYLGACKYHLQEIRTLYFAQTSYWLIFPKPDLPFY